MNVFVKPCMDGQIQYTVLIRQTEMGWGQKAKMPDTLQRAKVHDNIAAYAVLLTHHCGLYRVTLSWSSLTFAVCRRLHRLDQSHGEWLLFELNIYSSGMGLRELTNTQSFCWDICKYYLLLISLLIPALTLSVCIIIMSGGSISIDRLGCDANSAVGCY